MAYVCICGKRYEEADEFKEHLDQMVEGGEYVLPTS